MKRLLVFIVLLSFLFFNLTKANAQYAIINDYRLPLISSIFSLDNFYELQAINQ